MDEAAATAELERMVASDEDPVLDTTAVAALLALAKRPDDNGGLPTNIAADVDDWVASTAYLVGDVVQPVPNDGRFWRCAIGGTSSATQPVWPDLRGQVRTARLVSDGYVTWEDIGGVWVPTWDLAAAAAEGWNRKASLAAARYQFVTDGQQFFRQQVIANCHAQADRYRRKMGTVVV